MTLSNHLTRTWTVGILTLTLALATDRAPAQPDTPNRVPPPPRPIAPGQDVAPVDVADASQQKYSNPNGTGRLALDKTPMTGTRQTPFFLTNVPNRPPVGWSVGVYGGMNLYQEMIAKQQVTRITTPPAVYGVVDLPTDDLSSTIGSLAGVKLRYIWPFDDDPIPVGKETFDKGIRLAGVLELDMGYYGGKLSFETDSLTDSSFDIDGALAMMNFMLAADMGGNWRPYFGGGVGAALLEFSNYEYSDTAGGNPVVDETSDTNGAFAFQGILGTDYFITHEWSVFAEYRYLILRDFGLFSSPARVDVEDLSNHILSLGVRRNF